MYLVSAKFWLELEKIFFTLKLLVVKKTIQLQQLICYVEILRLGKYLFSNNS